MNDTIKGLVAKVSTLSDLLSFDPEIRPGFEWASLYTLVVVILALLLNRESTEQKIFEYLNSRGCGFDREVIGFLLDMFEGDDPEHHLWRLRGDKYFPLIEAMPPALREELTAARFD